MMMRYYEIDAAISSHITSLLYCLAADFATVPPVYAENYWALTKPAAASEHCRRTSTLYFYVTTIIAERRLIAACH